MAYVLHAKIPQQMLISDYKLICLAIAIATGVYSRSYSYL